MSKSTVTKYAVSRGQTIVSDLYDLPETAVQQNAHISDTMRGVGLEPDTHVVEVDVTTEVGRPKAWAPVEPAVEAEAPAEPEQAAE